MGILSLADSIEIVGRVVATTFAVYGFVLDVSCLSASNYIRLLVASTANNDTTTTHASTANNDTTTTTRRCSTWLVGTETWSQPGESAPRGRGSVALLGRTLVRDSVCAVLVMKSRDVWVLSGADPF